MRDTDLLARIGGDEFVAIGPGPEPGEAAQVVAAIFEQALGNCTVGQVQAAGVSFHYQGASVGVVAIAPGTASAQQALDQADELMYDAKSARRAKLPVRDMPLLVAAPEPGLAAPQPETWPVGISAGQHRHLPARAVNALVAGDEAAW